MKSPMETLAWLTRRGPNEDQTDPSAFFADISHFSMLIEADNQRANIWIKTSSSLTSFFYIFLLYKLIKINFPWRPQNLFTSFEPHCCLLHIQHLIIVKASNLFFFAYILHKNSTVYFYRQCFRFHLAVDFFILVFFCYSTWREKSQKKFFFQDHKNCRESLIDCWMTSSTTMLCIIV